MKKNYKAMLEEINTDLDDFKKIAEISNYDEVENTSTIDINLCKDELYQPFSEEKILNEDIFTYIERAFHFRKKNSRILFNLSFPKEMLPAEQQKIKQLIKLHYAVQLRETNQEIKRTNLKGTISLIIGALLFAIFGILEWFQVNFIFRGIIEIFSWVFIWEACNCYAFTNSRNKLNRLRYFLLFKASKELQE